MVRRVLQLVGLALLSDVAIIAAELIAGMDPIADFEQRPVLYLYMLLGTIVAFGVFGAVLGSREALLEERAIRDPLTGLFNSGYFHARLRQALASAQRLRTPLALVLFDADHFKRINDVHGHPVGDQVLRAIGATLEAQLRTGEIGARVGGEEFALLLPGTSAETAAAAAERIRRAIQQQVAVPGRVEPRTVTVSAGVACVAPGQTSPPAEIYQRADQALYQAKRAGRDRVVIAAAGDPASGGAD